MRLPGKTVTAVDTHPFFFFSGDLSALQAAPLCCGVRPLWEMLLQYLRPARTQTSREKDARAPCIVKMFILYFIVLHASPGCIITIDTYLYVLHVSMRNVALVLSLSLTRCGALSAKQTREP